MIVIKNEKTRRILGAVLPLIAIPAVIAVGVFVFDEKKYAFISLAVTLLSLLFFVTGFEKKKTGTRRLIITSIMTALSVTGRFIPFFKPVTALTVITGMHLGGEAGFLVGALSAVISNFYFGQGPWTPFQMFAWGLLGLLAGLISEPLKSTRILLLLYGVFSGVAYSFLMDVWTVLWYNGSFDLSLYLTALATAVPYTILYSISNVVFLLIFSKPFGEKLERVKLKYGI